MPPRESNAWELAQDHLREVLDEHTYKNWFSQTYYESFADGMLTVGVPSQFFADWLRDHYMDAISESVGKVIPDFRELRFTTGAEASGPPLPARTSCPVPAPQDLGPGRTSDLAQSSVGLNTRYTFERFVVGSGNRFAHAAAKAVAESPGRAYNPLFFYGGTGLGKTHLMQAIGHEILARNPQASVVFMSSEHLQEKKLWVKILHLISHLYVIHLIRILKLENLSRKS